MGVDTKITLPAHVHLRDCADALGKLMGCPSRLIDLQYGGIAVRVDGVEVAPNPTPGIFCADIAVTPPDGGLYERTAFLWHWEWGLYGDHGIIRRSHALNIALFVRLAEFFGGSVDFSDCDDNDEDHFTRSHASVWGYRTENDGGGWDRQQRALHALTPVTVDEVARYKATAEYPR